MSNFSQSQTVVGLGTTTINIPSAGRFAIDGKISLPLISQDAGRSSVVATINQNGSPIYTGQAGAEGFHTAPFCAANDVITIVLSSSAPADQGLNVIKTTIAVSEGV